jgi:hypothetical protein
LHDLAGDDESASRDQEIDHCTFHLGSVVRWGAVRHAWVSMVSIDFAGLHGVAPAQGMGVGKIAFG